MENTLFDKSVMEKIEFSVDQKLLALSWKQPFAELMLHGKIETRTWSTNYRGWVLICASKIPYTWQQVSNITDCKQHERINETLDLNTARLKNIRSGVAIAIGKLINCRPMKLRDEDKCFVQYYPDLFCHVYDNVQAIIPFQWKGSQGWKEVSLEVKKSLRIRVKN